MTRFELEIAAALDEVRSLRATMGRSADRVAMKSRNLLLYLDKRDVPDDDQSRHEPKEGEDGERL